MFVFTVVMSLFAIPAYADNCNCQRAAIRAFNVEVPAVSSVNASASINTAVPQAQLQIVEQPVQFQAIQQPVVLQVQQPKARMRLFSRLFNRRANVSRSRAVAITRIENNGW